MKRIFALVLILLPSLVFAQIQVGNKIQGKGDFPIVNATSATAILYDSKDLILVQKAATFLANDIEMVTNKKPEVKSSGEPSNEHLIIIGSIGNSRYIDQLISDKKLNVDPIRGQWERFIIQTVDNPFPGVKQALVIAGSDKRGTSYGAFTISEQIGVSPWYWWADVPVKKNNQLFIKKGRHISDGPSVKYRGIFLNDEAPALTNWAKQHFGGFNHKFYEKVFELILRNKGNYLWPAMWLPVAFGDDDPENPRVADEFGIIISTSHHEPMMRAHHEWYRFNGGAWNYETNKEKLQKFWRGGIERMKNYESVVTIGMRGDGDEALSEETAVDLLKTIVADQRKIIADVTGKPAEKTPQVWALYKEVQDYYDKGMRVDDDILILLADDNWGNVRFLPKKEDIGYKGGFGMYYHFDYVGAPVSYRWHNVTQIERVWEQMKLTYDWGVKDLWIVNVGDIKPMEFPISFFFDMAWDVKSFAADNLSEFYVNWTKKQFGDEHADEIAEIIALYTKYNSRRIPEMLKPDTYSLTNYREADRILDEFRQLLDKSKDIYSKLPETHKSAFYQLVLSPVEMCHNLNEMYVTAGKNNLYTEEGRASTNFYAEKTKELFFKNEMLTKDFHENLEGGKWNHMMSQTHMGYTHWNHPRANKMPAVSYVQLKKEAELGFMVEYGTEPSWRGFSVEAEYRFSESFSPFDPVNDQSCFIEIYNLGKEELSYDLIAKNDWIKLSSNGGKVQYDEKVYVSIDWKNAPKGRTTGEISINGVGKEYTIKVPLRNDLPEVSGFVENNGVVSIEASNFTKKVDSKDILWRTVPNLGRTNSSMIVEPFNAESQTSIKDAPRLEYTFTTFDASDLEIETYLSPTQNFQKSDGLKFAVAIDDEEPQVINMNEGEEVPDWKYAEWWMKSVGDNIRIKQSVHKNKKPGVHTLKIWMIDPGVVFQKFVINSGGLKPSYLGPTESVFIQPSSKKISKK